MGQRVVYLTPHDLSEPGGPTTNILASARALASAGAEVYLVCKNPPSESVPGVNVVVAGNGWEATRITRSVSPDIVVTRGPYYTLLASLPPRNYIVVSEPYNYRVRGCWVRQSVLEYISQPLALRLVDYFATQTPELCEALGVPQWRCVDTYPTAPKEYFRGPRSTHDNFVLYYGSITFYNKSKLLRGIVERLVANGVDVRVNVPPPQEEAARKLFPRNVEVTSGVKVGDELLRSATLVLAIRSLDACGGLYEVPTRTAIASALGTPILANPTPAYRYVFDDRGIVYAETPEQAVKAFRQVASNFEKYSDDAYWVALHHFHPNIKAKLYLDLPKRKKKLQ